MQKANLKILGLNVPLGLFDVYHDDGFVSSTNDHTKKLLSRYGKDHIGNRYGLEKDRNSIKESPARYVCFNGVLRNHHHIFYKDIGFIENLITRGHEEAEFLEEVGQLDLLVKRLLHKTNKIVDLEDIRDGEVKCHFGSVYALMRHDVPVKKLFEVIKPNQQIKKLQLLLKHYGFLS